MEKNLDIIVAGYLDLDIIPEFMVEKKVSKISEVIIPGGIAWLGNAAVVPGGPVTNTGVSLKKLGIKVDIMGVVGTDTFGKSLVDLLKEHEDGQPFRGVKVVDGVVTPYVIAIVIPGIERVYLIHPSYFGEDDVDYDLVKETRVFHLGYPPEMPSLYENDGQQLLNIFKKVKDLGVTTSLDMAVPDLETAVGRIDWSGLLKRWIPYTDIMVPSVEETLFFLDKDKFMRLRNEVGREETLLDHLTPDDIIPLGEQLIEMGAAIAMVKCGYHGLYINTAGKDRLKKMGAGRPADLDNWANRQMWSPVYEVKNIIGALGSGDSAIAGFFGAYLKGKKIEDCLRYGNAAGSRNVTVPDGLSWNKGFEDLTSRIQEGWKSDPLEIPVDGWCRKEELWYGKKDKSNA